MYTPENHCSLAAVDHFEFMNYVVPLLFFLSANYGTMRNRKLLLLDKGKFSRHSHKWKEVLRTLGDAVIICAQGKIVFHNQAMESILDKLQENCDMCAKVFLCRYNSCRLTNSLNRTGLARKSSLLAKTFHKQGSSTSAKKYRKELTVS